jgi:hypothetical protein
MRWLSLFLACQHLNWGTNLRECEDQSWFKVRFDWCKMFSSTLWDVYEYALRCFRVSSEMFASTLWDVCEYPLRCLQVRSEMFTSTLWDVFEYPLRCLRVRSEMFLSTLWDVCEYPLRCLRVPSEMFTSTLWDVFEYPLRWSCLTNNFINQFVQITLSLVGKLNKKGI